MNIKDSVVLLTGANRGLGLALAQALLKAGARKVYGGARDKASVTLPGLTPLQLDVTSAADIAAAVAAAPDVTLVINNAGIIRGTSFLGDGAIEGARAELETNYFGPLLLSRAFAPTLKRNGGGRIVNVLSVLSWLNLPGAATYSASKAAAWSLSNGLRGELAAQGTGVTGVHLGYMDTDMTAGLEVDKISPAAVADQVLAAVEANQDEVLADDITRHVKQGLSAPRGVYLGEAQS
jgi:NAD(P)-dependent dehydrogenase (short-subunit alcohol dehydrogenase family)